MNPSNKVILFDIDYTLFDQDSYRDRFFPLLGREIGMKNEKDFFILKNDLDKKTREIAGFFDPYVFLSELIKYSRTKTTLNALEKVFFNNDIYETSLYKDSISVLKKLHDSQKYLLGILSTGHTKHQNKKIETIKNFFSQKDIHIFTDKNKFLKTVLKKYKDFPEIYIVDDNLEVLMIAKKLNNNLTTIFMKKKKKYERFYPQVNYKPDYTFENISDILSILK